MTVDRLVEHQAAIVETQHGPGPFIFASLNGEAQLLVELDARGDALHGQHWYETGHFHGS